MDHLLKYNSFDDEFRNKMVKKIDSVVTNMSTTRKIEKSIYNYVINLCKQKGIKQKWTNPLFMNIYLTKSISIYSNLKKDSYIKNKDFLNNVINGKINPEEIANISHFDIFPEIWKDLIDKKISKDKLKYSLKPEAMTDAFKCRKCESRSCSYYEVQTRSADEPMTQFINCLDCGNHWRQ